MKLTTGILGCALAAGLVTFASDKAQASVVIGNTVYAPFKLKISTQYPDGNKLKKASMSSKEFLTEAGFNGKVQLAVNTDTYDVWVINKDTLVQNLSTNDLLWIDFSSTQTVLTSGESSNTEKYKETGVLEVYSEGVGDVNNYFDISGVFSDSYSYGAVKNGEYKYSENLSAKNLSGTGYFVELFDGESDLPVTGSASYKGNGKLEAL